MSWEGKGGDGTSERFDEWIKHLQKQNVVAVFHPCRCWSLHHTGALRYPSSPSRGSLPLPPHYSLNIYMARSNFVRNLAMTLVSSPMSPTISPLWSPWLWLVAWPTPHLAIDDLPLYPVHHQRIFPIQTRTTSIDPNWGIERVMPQHGGTIAKEIK